MRVENLLFYLCKTSSLRIINGRVTGDKSGAFTRYSLHDRLDVDPSVIDYGLVNAQSISQVERFTVSKLTLLSDHCCISLRLKTRNNKLSAKWAQHFLGHGCLNFTMKRYQEAWRLLALTTQIQIFKK